MTSSGHEWQFHIATDICWSRMAINIATDIYWSTMAINIAPDI